MAHTSPPFTSSLQPPATSDMNRTLTAVSRCEEHHGVLHIPFAVLYCLIFVLGLAGNLVALWVFFCVHSKKNSVRVFLINVAFADLLLVACLPFRILYHSQHDVWTLRPVTCKLVGTLFYANMYISITLLGLISIDRYLKMHRGSGAQRRLRSTRGSHGLCAVVWIGAFTLTVPFLLSNTDDPADKCFQYKELHNAKWKAYINIFLVALFWLVFISLVVSYGKIALRLLRTSQEKPDLPNTARYTRTAKKSFFVLFLFTVCFVPYHVVRIFYIATQITETTTCYWRNVADKANETALLLSALNSCLDPVMYFLLSSSVRKEVLRLMSGVLCVRRDIAASSGSSSTAEGDGRMGRGDRGHASKVVIVGKVEEEEERTGTGHSNLVCEDSLRQ